MPNAQFHKSSRRTREVRAEENSPAHVALADLEPGTELFVLTHGQFSLIDGLVYLSHKIGPCDLSVCTWTAGARDLQYMADMLASGQFRSVRWLVDRSFVTRQPAYCRKLRDLFGDDCIRTTRSHAKFVTMRNEKWDLAVRTSMNLNHNPRMECIEISDDPVLADFIDSQFDLYFDEQEPGVLDSELRSSPQQTQIEMGTVSANRLYSEPT